MTDRRHDVVSLLPVLRRYARSLTRDDGAAQDLVHDALVSALENLGGFDQARPMQPWLLRIVHNIFVSGVRREQVRQAHAAVPAVVPADQPSPDAVLELEHIQRDVANLPVDQRAVLHLVVVEGLSYREAADALGIPTGTVMSRLARARRRLRANMEDGSNAAGLRLVSSADGRP